VVSQFALAIPIILLYEVSILIGRVIEKKRAAEAQAEEDDEDKGAGEPAAPVA
jgi:sec-independent protein translocase protein TatC